MMIYTYQRSKKKKTTSKKLQEARNKHNKFLASLGVSTTNRKRKYVTDFPDLTVISRCTATVSNQIPGNGFKRSIDDYKWRAGREEKPETIKAAEDKKKRIAPAFNKGPVMYITDEADKISLGRKV